jgi:hypothetical protein
VSRRAFVLALMVLSGCENLRTEPAPAQPAPVAPVEVTPQEQGSDPEELARLRARVAELEQELRSCRDSQAPPPSGTQTAVVPEGLDVPDETPPSTTSAAPQDAGTRRRASSQRRDRDRDPSLLDTILGTDGRRRGGTSSPETIELPNPARVLLGD